MTIKCVIGNAHKLLNKADRDELITLLDQNTADGMSEVDNVYDSIQTMIVDALADRQDLREAPGSTWPIIADRSINLEPSTPQAPPRAPQSKGEPFILTANNTEEAINLLNEMKPGPNSNTLVRDNLVKRLKKSLNKPSPLSDIALKNINKYISDAGIIKPSTKAKDASTKVSMAEDILTNSQRYEKDIKGTSVDYANRPSITDWMRVKVGSKSTNVLRNTPNMFSRLSNKNKAQEVLSELPFINAEQTTALRDLTKYTKKFTKTLLGTSTVPGLYGLLTKTDIYQNNLEPSINKKDNTESSGDPFGFMINVDPITGEKSLNENLVSAMAVASYNWAGTQGESTLFNDDTAINRMTGNHPDSTPSVIARDALRNVGVSKPVLAETIGKEVMKLTGLEAIPGTDAMFLPRLEMAVGLLTIAVMEENNILDQTPVSGKDMYEFSDKTKDESEFNTKLPRTFVRVMATEESLNNPYLEAVPAVTDIKASMEADDGLMKVLFDIATYTTGPMLNKSTSIPDKIKGSIKDVPKKLKAVIKNMQSVKWALKESTYDTLNTLTDDQLFTILGGNTNVDGEHITKRHGIKGKNLSIRREIENIRKFVDDIPDKDMSFFFEYHVRRNTRVHITSNTVNPETSLLHRHVLSPEQNKVDITPDKRTLFKIAVLAGFAGGLNYKVDQNGVEASIDKFDELMEVPLVKKYLETGSTKDLMAAIEYGGEGIATMDTLIALKAYHPTETFTVDLMLEVDGVTNGVAFTLLQMPDEQNILGKLRSVGAFTEETPINFPTWKGMGKQHKDSYERLAVVLDGFSKDVITKSDNQDTSLLDLVFSPLTELVDIEVNGETKTINVATSAGRKLAKSPLLTDGYGAGIKRIKQLVFDDALSNLYSAYVIDPQGTVDTVNKILGTNETTPTNINEVLEAEFSRDTLEKLEDYLDVVIGGPLKNALEAQFPEYARLRAAINNASKVMFYTFKVHYEARLAEALKTNNGVPLSEEAKATIVEEMGNLVPSVRAASSEGTKDGILLLQKDKTRDYGYKNQVQVKFTRPINNTMGMDTKGKLTNKGTKNSSGTIAQSTFTDAGASTVSTMVQSMDSATIAEVLLKFDMLNVFDAGGFNINDAQEGVDKINQTFMDVSNSFSMAQAVEESMVIMLKTSIKDVPKYRKIDALIKGDDKLNVGEEGSINTAHQALLSLRRLRKQSDAARKEIIPQISQVSQYALATSIDTVEVEPIKASKMSTTEQINEAVDGVLQVQKDEGLSSIAEADIDFDGFIATYNKNLTAQNSLDIFEEVETLGNVRETADRQADLRNILSNLVNKVIVTLDEKDVDLKINEDGDVVYGAIKDNKIRIHAGKGTIGHANQLSTQEVLVHELVHRTTQYALDTNFTLRKQVQKLMEEVRKVTTVEDFLARNPDGSIKAFVNEKAERKAAQERFDYIFNSANQLHEFMAFGLTNKLFNDKLKSITASPEVDFKKGSLKDKLYALYIKILDWITGNINKSPNISADVALLSLAESIVGINDKHKLSILNSIDFINPFNQKATDALHKVIFKPMGDYYDALKAVKEPSVIQRTAKTIIGLPLIALDTTKSAIFSDVVSQVTRNIGITERSFIVKLVREIAGVTEQNYLWHKLLVKSKKFIEQARRHLSENVKQHLIESIKSDEKLTLGERTGLTKTILKTDLSSVLEPGKFSVGDLLGILGEDTTKLDKEIEKTKKALRTYDGSNFYIQQSEGLGVYMATGEVILAGQALNATNIANMAYLDNAAPVNDAEVIIKLIDKLTTFQAIKNTSVDHKVNAAKVIKREYEADPKDNLITQIIHIHNKFKEDSKEKLFDNYDSSMIKGYTHEIFSPDVDFQIGSKADEQMMADNGYYPSGDHLQKDGKDTSPVSGSILYVNKVNGLNTKVSTVVSLRSRKAKGTSLYQTQLDSQASAPAATARAVVNDVYKATQADLIKQTKSENISAVSRSNNNLLPIIGNAGKMVDFRYTMTESVKDTLLEKNNNITSVLGGMMGSVVDKEQSKNINIEVVNLAYTDYLKDFAKNPGEFTRISPTSTNKKDVELYALLPQEMKDEIKKVWSGKDIHVKTQFLDLIFGFRKLSIADATVVKHLTSSSLGGALKADRNIRLAENIWFDLVGLAKSNIVIKSFVVLRDNIISNNFLLWVKGVPVADIWKNQTLALAALNNYQKELSARDILQRKLDTDKTISPTVRKSMKGRVALYNSNLATNPISVLIDEGVFQSIVEDIDPDDNEFGLVNKGRQKVLNAIDTHASPTATTIFKQAYLDKSTIIYKSLLKATQYSDFVARFALYQNNINNKKMNKEAALLDVVETFVNYDVPTSPELQWLNDMGILMFTKFLFRIQKVVFKAFKENPANALALYTLQQGLGDVPDISDSFMPNIPGRLRNTFIETPEDASFLPGYEFTKWVVGG